MESKIMCKKDWYLDGNLIFKKDISYSIIDHHIDGDKKIKAFQITDAYNDGYNIWFWSGSSYFKIDYLE